MTKIWLWKREKMYTKKYLSAKSYPKMGDKWNEALHKHMMQKLFIGLSWTEYSALNVFLCLNQMIDMIDMIETFSKREHICTKTVPKVLWKIELMLTF